MQYKLTPFNIGSVGLIAVSIWAAINPGPEGWGLLLLYYLLPSGVIFLLIDLLIQKFSKVNYRMIVITEIAVVSLIVFAFSRRERTKTLIIPDKIHTSFIVTIYEVDGADKLPFSIFNWDYEIKVPANGIILTSNSFNSDMPETKIKTYSGKNLGTDETNLKFTRLMDSEINCSGRKYKYRSWLVDTICCGYSTRQVKDLNHRLEKYFCDRKPSL